MALNKTPPNTKRGLHFEPLEPREAVSASILGVLGAALLAEGLHREPFERDFWDRNAETRQKNAHSASSEWTAATFSKQPLKIALLSEAALGGMEFSYVNTITAGTGTSALDFHFTLNTFSPLEETVLKRASTFVPPPSFFSAGTPSQALPEPIRTPNGGVFSASAFFDQLRTESVAAQGRTEHRPQETGVISPMTFDASHSEATVYAASSASSGGGDSGGIPPHDSCGTGPYFSGGVPVTPNEYIGFAEQNFSFITVTHGAQDEYSWDMNTLEYRITSGAPVVANQGWTPIDYGASPKLSLTGMPGESMVTISIRCSEHGNEVSQNANVIIYQLIGVAAKELTHGKDPNVETNWQSPEDGNVLWTENQNRFVCITNPIANSDPKKTYVQQFYSQYIVHQNLDINGNIINQSIYNSGAPYSHGYYLVQAMIPKMINGVVQTPTQYTVIDPKKYCITGISSASFETIDGAANKIKLTADGTGGAMKCFPEQDAPNGTLHNKLNVKVTLALPIMAGLVGTVHLKWFDPDNPLLVDKNDTAADNANRANDNNGSAALAATTLSFAGGESVKTTLLTIGKAHAGDDYIIATHPNAGIVDEYVFGTDGKTLQMVMWNGFLGGIVGKQTPILTVWRTLNVECDRLFYDETDANGQPLLNPDGSEKRIYAALICSMNWDTLSDLGMAKGLIMSV